MSEFQANPNLINRELANRSHCGTSFDPEIRARQEIDGFAAEVQHVYEELSKYAKSDAQKALLNEEIARFQAGYAAKYNDKLAAHGRCISSFITGPSGFPTSRAEKANRSYENRVNEMLEYKERAITAIRRELKRLAVEEAGGELEVLKQKLATAERHHELMKQANVILRSKATNEDKVKQLMAIRFSEALAHELLNPDFAGRTGYTFELTNNLANIKRMKERLAQIQKKEDTPTSDTTFTGGRIVDNAEADRVQILFDAIPDQATRDRLKGNGWRWSPANKAWQRKRTPQALYDAKRVTNCDEHAKIGESLSSS